MLLLQQQLSSYMVPPISNLATPALSLSRAPPPTSCWARRVAWCLKQCSFLTNPDFEDFACAGQAEKAAAATTQFRRRFSRGFCIVVVVVVASQAANQETNSASHSSDSNTDAMTDHDQGNSSNSRGSCSSSSCCDNSSSRDTRNVM